jgi:hypothetical protein
MIYSKFIHLCLFTDLYVKLICFSHAFFHKWIDMEQPLVAQIKIPTTESKREYLEQMKEMRKRCAR